jgi:hypothetical protein
VSYVCAGKSFASLSEAKVFAELLFQSKGTVAAIEKPKKGAKAAKKQAEAAIKARIQRSVVGFLIPMMSIPKLYKLQEAAIAEGKSDEELKAIVAAFPGVMEA